MITQEQKFTVNKMAEFIVNMIKANPLRKEIAQEVLKEIEEMK